MSGDAGLYCEAVSRNLRFAPSHERWVRTRKHTHTNTLSKASSSSLLSSTSSSPIHYTSASKGAFLAPHMGVEGPARARSKNNNNKYLILLCDLIEAQFIRQVFCRAEFWICLCVCVCAQSRLRGKVKRR